MKKVERRKTSGFLPTACRDWRGKAQTNQKSKCKMQKYNAKIKYSKYDPPNKFEGLNRIEIAIPAFAGTCKDIRGQGRRVQFTA